MKTIVALAFVLGLGCGGVAAEAPDASAGAGGGAGVGGGGMAGAGGGAMAGAQAGAGVGGGAGVAGAAGGEGDAGGQAGAGAGGMATDGGAGAAGSAGGAPEWVPAVPPTAAGRSDAAPMGQGLVAGQPWCATSRPAGVTMSCLSKYAGQANTTTVAPGGDCKATKVDPWWGQVNCNRSCSGTTVTAYGTTGGISETGCVAGAAPAQTFNYNNADGSQARTIACAGYATLCVTSCSECP
jgi:hypothetical protein